MLSIRSSRTALTAALALTVSSTALAADYTEAVDGDISDDRLAPTSLALDSGDNSVTCDQQGDAFGRDIDYLRVTVPAGQVLSQLFVDGYVAAPGNQAFFGFQAGSTFTVDASSASPADLLGGAIYGEFDVGSDILPSTFALGSMGGSAPLPAGDYTFWLQQTGPNSEVTLRFVIEGAPTFGTPYCTPAVDNSSGAPGEITAFGSDEVAANDLTVLASNLPPMQFGLAVVSNTQDFVPGAGGSLGNLCLGGAIGRYNGQIQSSGPLGEILIDVDLTAIPQPSSLVAAQAGETWNFQLWHRDVGPAGPASNFTPGLAVTLR
ncbi:MAG: hypothetical protein AAFZ87_02230 [Planctomycetota bacterium]